MEKTMRIKKDNCIFATVKISKGCCIEISQEEGDTRISSALIRKRILKNKTTNESRISDVTVPPTNDTVTRSINCEQNYEDVDVKSSHLVVNDLRDSSDKSNGTSQSIGCTNVDHVTSASLNTLSLNVIKPSSINLDNVQYPIIANVFSSVQLISNDQQQGIVCNYSPDVAENSKSVNQNVSQEFEERQMSINVDTSCNEERIMKKDTIADLPATTVYITKANNKVISKAGRRKANSSVQNKKTDKEELLQCTKCDKKFNKLAPLTAHKLKCHPKGNGKVIKMCTYTDCNFKTERSSAFKRHREIHESKPSHECPTCHKKYIHLFNFETHKRIHEGLPVYRCGKCEFITRHRSSLRRHNVIYHMGKKAFTCFACDKKFGSGSDLKRHVRSHTGQKPYLCNQCGQLFRQSAHLRLHQAKHHPKHIGDKDVPESVMEVTIETSESLVTNDNINKGIISETLPNTDLPHATDKSGHSLAPLVLVNSENCDTNFFLEESYLNLTSKLYVMDECESSSKVCVELEQDCEPSSNLKIVDLQEGTSATCPEKILTPVPSLHCSLCNKDFRLARDYKRHQNIHQGKKHYQCKNCSFITIHPSALRNHKKNAHKLAHCSVCQVEVEREQLRKHMKTHGEQFKMFNCGHCDFSSKYSSVVTKHKRRHDNDRLCHSCGICQEKFLSEYQLYIHIQKHAGRKLHACDECSFVTKHHHSLSRHKLLHMGHRPFHCEYCSSTFISKCDLERHIRCHKGEKPFVCNVCHCQFSQKSHLTIHKTKHALHPEEVKTRKCLKCSLTFHELSALIDHEISCLTKKNE